MGMGSVSRMSVRDVVKLHLGTGVVPMYVPTERNIGFRAIVRTSRTSR